MRDYHPLLLLLIIIIPLTPALCFITFVLSLRMIVGLGLGLGLGLGRGLLSGQVMCALGDFDSHNDPLQ